MCTIKHENTNTESGIFLLNIMQNLTSLRKWVGGGGGTVHFVSRVIGQMEERVSRWLSEVPEMLCF